MYWGAPNITDYVDELCFVDRRKFSSYEEVYAYLNSMTEDEYNQRIETIKKYLQSEKYAYFTPSVVAQQLVKNIMGR